LIVLGIPLQGAAWKKTAHRPVNQAPRISIQNFQVVDVSSGELRVTVDYTYPDTVRATVLIHATPDEKGGIFDPRTVEFDEVLVQTGTHTATLAITKRPTGPVFTSVAVRVCISSSSRALLCQDFPYEKTWTNSAGQMCSISGRLFGLLEGLSYPDHPGPPTRVSLRAMSLERRDGKRWSVSIRNRSYTFSNLEAGVVYTVFPSGFQSESGAKLVQCRGNTRHHVNFRITRPTSQG